MSMKGITIFITGGSRGIGLAIAKRCAREGANIAIAAKTAEPHPNLPGTIYTAAQEIEQLGAKALPLICDVRFEDQIEKAINECVKVFGGLDILINNASAIWVQGTKGTPMKKFDLMNQCNGRATYATSFHSLPHLLSSSKLREGKQHILTISPPINMNKRWFRDHVAYTISKYSMSMCCKGMSEELREEGVAVNCLWPKTAIATSALEWIGGKDSFSSCRSVEIMADAAFGILSKDSRKLTGNFFIDEDYLRDFENIQNFDHYSISPGAPLLLDFFLDDPNEKKEEKGMEDSLEALKTARSKL